MSPDEPRPPGPAAWVWWAASAVILIYMGWEHFPVAGEHRAKDWQFFYRGAEALGAEGGADLYKSFTTDTGEWAYIYPPLLAFILTPLVPLGFEGSARVWIVLSVVGLAAGLVAASADGIRRLPRERGPPRLAFAVFLTLLLSVNVARREIEHAQTDWLTMLAFVAGLLWTDRRPLLAGLALGMAANIKYQTLIALPYLIVRGRLRAAAYTAASTVAWALLPAVTIGWSENLEYLNRALGGIWQFVGIEVAQRAAVWSLEDPDSISIPSAFGRASAALGFGKGLVVILTGAAAAGCAGLAWWMYRANGRAFWTWGRPDAEGGPGGERSSGSLIPAAEWAGLIVASIVFSPQTLKRHLFLMVPVYALTVVMLLSRSGPGRAGFRAGKGLLAAGLVVSAVSMVLPFRWRGMTETPEWWRGAAGTCWCQLFFFFTLLWTVLAWERPRPGPRGVPDDGSNT